MGDDPACPQTAAHGDLTCPRDLNTESGAISPDRGIHTGYGTPPVPVLPGLPGTVLRFLHACVRAATSPGVVILCDSGMKAERPRSACVFLSDAALSGVCARNRSFWRGLRLVTAGLPAGLRGCFLRLAPVRELVGIGGVVAALSVASDLTRGHPPGEAMRACLLATELARRAGLDRVRQGEVYYGTLLRFAGCAATSHEIAAAFGGDDIVVRARGDLIDPTVPAEAMQFLAGLGVDAEGLRVLGGAEGVAGLKAEGARADCEVGAVLAGPPAVAGGGGPRRSGRLRALRWLRRAGRPGRR